MAEMGNLSYILQLKMKQQQNNNKTDKNSTSTQHTSISGYRTWVSVFLKNSPGDTARLHRHFLPDLFPTFATPTTTICHPFQPPPSTTAPWSHSSGRGHLNSALSSGHSSLSFRQLPLYPHSPCSSVHPFSP